MLLASILWVPLVACSGTVAPAAETSGPATAEDDRPLVLATFTVIADIGRAVAGEDLRVESVTRPGAEIHGYEPTPSDLTRGQGADLLIANGLGLEAWFERFTQDIDAPTVVLTEGIEPISISVGESAGAANPHAWMSPRMAHIYVDNLVRAFSELSPAHAEGFRARGDAYRAELDAIDGELREAVAAIPEQRRFLATCEGAFSYLARDLGLSEGYLWAVNQESEGTPQQVAALIDEVRERRVPTVFCESTVSDSAQRQVAAETGAVLGELLYVDSLSDGPPVGSYLELLRHDARAIAAGLTR